MTHRPTIEICIPVFNAAAFVAETIDSALAQDFADIRVLISVDLSNDDSAGICQGYVSDERVQVFRQKQRLGYVGNTNFLLRQATAPLVKILPHDDVMPPDLLGRLFHFMQQAPGCAVAFPGLRGFGYGSVDFRQSDVRGPVLRRLMDVMMNQRFVAAFHGLVRISPEPGERPLLPAGFLRDFETDVQWMAQAACHGELRSVEHAVELKRFSPAMKSQTWIPRSTREAHQLLAQHTARLTELAWVVCRNEEEHRQVMMAALVRLLGLGLNYGIPLVARQRPFFALRIFRAWQRELTGPAAEVARRASLSELLRTIRQDQGIVGASLLASRIQPTINAGQIEAARRMYDRALSMDPLAGWAEELAPR